MPPKKGCIGTYKGLGNEALSETIARRAGKRAYYAANREKFIEYGARWRANNRAKIREKYLKNRGAAQARHRKKKYGLTPSDFESMRESQGGACAICCEPFTKVPHIDHCHSNGQVRGLLCGECNRGLGRFKDDPVRLEAAITYLRCHMVKLTLKREA